MLVKKLFDKLGKEVDNEEVAFAKETTFESGQVKYYIKFSTRGPDSGLILDPYGPWFNGLNNKIFDKRNNFVSKYEFKNVSKKIFDLYLHFLKTTNHSFLRQAERELINEN